jgi:phosphate transport system ATP-binding protein
MSVRDNITFGPRQHGKSRRGELDGIVETSLHGVGMWDEVKDKLRQPAQSLSSGQQQRLCIARLLAVEPEVILMDEPCSALDPEATLKVEDLMRKLAESYTIVIVTHNMQQAARVSDTAAFVMMAQDGAGELVEFGLTAQIFTNPADKRTENYITGRFG